MSLNAYAFVVTTFAEQRVADLRAQADRERQAQLAQTNANRHQPLTGFAIVLAVVAVALVLAGFVQSEDAPLPAPPILVQAEERVASQVLETHLLDPSAARQVRETYL